MDVGIDLGTATVIVYIGGEGVVLSEPSVIAVNLKTDSVISVGQEAYEMIGKTPSHIQAIRPLSKGVVCNYKMTEEMVKHFIKKICKDSLIKPRIAMCVPSGITNVESNAVIDVAIASGARKVYLIEEFFLYPESRKVGNAMKAVCIKSYYAKRLKRQAAVGDELF